MDAGQFLTDYIFLVLKSLPGHAPKKPVLARTSIQPLLMSGAGPLFYGTAQALAGFVQKTAPMFG
jgi:hypothetical protein